MRSQKNLVKTMRDGEFILSVQIDPPRSIRTNDLVDTARILKKTGISVLDINSSKINSNGHISHDSIHMAANLSGIGFETIPHVTLRDSALSGILNQILAAYAWQGLRNFLVITGDPHRMPKNVMPLLNVPKINIIKALGFMSFQLRKALELDVSLGAAINQNAPRRSYEIARTTRKWKAGADFFMSQPIFSEKQFVQLLAMYEAAIGRRTGKRAARPPLIVGIWPLVSQKTIERIWNGRVDGVVIPKDIYATAGAFAEDSEKLSAWGLANSKKLVETIRASKKAQGVYLVAPARIPLQLLPLIKELQGTS